MNIAQPCKELEICNKFITMCVELNWIKELKAGFEVRSRIRESIINRAMARTSRRFNV